MALFLHQDTHPRMFDKDYIERDQEDDMNNDGLKIGQMIKHPKGKIHILYNPMDAALIISGNLTGRLGRRGANEGDSNLHPDLVGKVSSYNYRKNHMSFCEQCTHNYHFAPPALAYYDANYLE